MPAVDWDKTESILVTYPTIMAAWLFGSANQGRMHPNSDIDIAVLFTMPPNLDILSDLRYELQQTLPFAEIDLVVLNQTNPILRFEAVSGRNLYCRDPYQRATFVSLTAREYEDSMAMMQHHLVTGIN
jgi:predicted nucleotidyltransferase